MASGEAVENVFGNNEYNDQEEEDEKNMTMKEIAEEEGKSESKKILRCKQCRRMTFGHEGPYGEQGCKLERITDDEVLKEDDKMKNKKRVEKRGKVK